MQCFHYYLCRREAAEWMINMKKCNCSCKITKIIFKVLGIVLVANIALFAVFFFDLDGKFFFNVFEPFMKKHYDNMERKDTLAAPYEIDKYGKFE